MAEKIKTGQLKTWEEINTFDDIILESEREIISDLEKEIKDKDIETCPHLKKEGKFFYYCGFDLSEVKDKKPSCNNPIYKRKIDLICLQLHCLDNYKGCCIYSGKLKF